MHQAALDVGEYHGWQKYTMVGTDVWSISSVRGDPEIHIRPAGRPSSRA